MHLPAHINPNDRSPEAMRNRAMHAQAMLQLSPNGNGFRRIPEKSNQTSIVEGYLIAAGDMEPLPVVPSDRRYRQVRRERLAKPEEKRKPAMVRGLSLEPGEQFVEQVSEAFKDAKSPAEFVLGFVHRLGLSSIAEYDRMATRAERFMRSVEKNPRKRVPSHIRDWFVMKRLVELVLAKRWPSASAVPA